MNRSNSGFHNSHHMGDKHGPCYITFTHKI